MPHMKLRVPRPVYKRRLARMKKLIELKAPAVILYYEARLIMRGYGPNWWGRCVEAWLDTRFGSSLYRWMDPEWIRFKLTGKSDVYGPSLLSDDQGR